MPGTKSLRRRYLRRHGEPIKELRPDDCYTNQILFVVSPEASGQLWSITCRT